jgi:hypothetical protein
MHLAAYWQVLPMQVHISVSDRQLLVATHTEHGATPHPTKCTSDGQSPRKACDRRTSGISCSCQQDRTSAVKSMLVQLHTVRNAMGKLARSTAAMPRKGDQPR